MSGMIKIGVGFLAFLLMGVFSLSVASSCAPTSAHGPYCVSEQWQAPVSLLELEEQTGALPILELFFAAAFYLAVVFDKNLLQHLDPTIRFRFRFVHPALFYHQPLVLEMRD